MRLLRTSEANRRRVCNDDDATLSATPQPQTPSAAASPSKRHRMLFICAILFFAAFGTRTAAVPIHRDESIDTVSPTTPPVSLMPVDRDVAATTRSAFIDSGTAPKTPNESSDDTLDASSKLIVDDTVLATSIVHSVADRVPAPAAVTANGIDTATATAAQKMPIENRYAPVSADVQDTGAHLATPTHLNGANENNGGGGVVDDADTNSISKSGFVANGRGGEQRLPLVPLPEAAPTIYPRVNKIDVNDGMNEYIVDNAEENIIDNGLIGKVSESNNDWISIMSTRPNIRSDDLLHGRPSSSKSDAATEKPFVTVAAVHQTSFIHAAIVDGNAKDSTTAKSTSYTTVTMRPALQGTTNGIDVVGSSNAQFTAADYPAENVFVPNNDLLPNQSDMHDKLITTTMDTSHAAGTQIHVKPTIKRTFATTNENNSNNNDVLLSSVTSIVPPQSVDVKLPLATAVAEDVPSDHRAMSNWTENHNTATVSAVKTTSDDPSLLERTAAPTSTPKAPPAPPRLRSIINGIVENVVNHFNVVENGVVTAAGDNGEKLNDIGKRVGDDGRRDSEAGEEDSNTGSTSPSTPSANVDSGNGETLNGKLGMDERVTFGDSTNNKRSDASTTENALTPNTDIVPSIFTTTEGIIDVNERQLQTLQSVLNYDKSIGVRVEAGLSSTQQSNIEWIDTQILQVQTTKKSHRFNSDDFFLPADDDDNDNNDNNDNNNGAATKHRTPPVNAKGDTGIDDDVEEATTTTTTTDTSSSTVTVSETTTTPPSPTQLPSTTLHLPAITNHDSDLEHTTHNRESTVERDSDTIFYISNTEVKVVESSVPTPNTNQESQFFPALYEEDVIIDFRGKNSTAWRAGNVNDKYEEDIILSPMKNNNFDALKIIDDNLSISYVGESFIDIKENTNGATAAAAASASFGISAGASAPPAAPSTSFVSDNDLMPSSNVIIEPALIPDVLQSIGVPIIAELPPQMDKNIDYRETMDERNTENQTIANGKLQVLMHGDNNMQQTQLIAELPKNDNDDDANGDAASKGMPDKRNSAKGNATAEAITNVTVFTVLDDEPDHGEFIYIYVYSTSTCT